MIRRFQPVGHQKRGEAAHGILPLRTCPSTWCPVHAPQQEMDENCGLQRVWKPVGLPKEQHRSRRGLDYLIPGAEPAREALHKEWKSYTSYTPSACEWPGKDEMPQQLE
nr:uncharacterized protein LOC110360612 [Columba livia]